MSDPVSYLYWVSGRPGSGWLVWTQTLITSHDHRPMELWSTPTTVRITPEHLWENMLQCDSEKLVTRWIMMSSCHNMGVSWPWHWHRWHNCHTAQIISHIPENYNRNQTQFVHYRVSWKDDATEIDLWWARLWWWKYKVGWDDHNKTHFYFQIAQSDQTRYTAERITRICPNVRRNQFKIPPSESSSKNYKFCFALFSVVHFIG